MEKNVCQVSNTEHPNFNLLYRDAEGKEIRAYRRKDVRRFVLEDGRELGHTWVSNNLEYVGRYNKHGVFNGVINE